MSDHLYGIATFGIIRFCHFLQQNHFEWLPMNKAWEHICESKHSETISSHETEEN